MSTSVGSAGSSGGQPVQLGLDPCAIVLVLIDKTEADVSQAAPAAPRARAGGDTTGHTLDRYA
ncbi:MAG TPA: hypothetical protein VMU14_19670 [Acidimicrobiales bacterium]|nr:hypothetical protein [Acidimicrobiales bacterium]